jgi:hypothetical protein
MLRRLLPGIACLAIFLVMATSIRGKEGQKPKLKPGQGYVEGHVKEGGQLVRDVDLMIVGSLKAQRYGLPMPIVTSYGGIYGAPRTDSKGYYKAILPSGTFLIYIQKGKHAHGSQNRLIEIAEGERTYLDFDLDIKWRAAESSLDEFKAGLNRVLAAAKQNAPLLSLAVRDGLPSTLITLVTLPGADSCSLMAVPPLSTGTNRQTPPLPFYDCSARYSSHERAIADYALLVKLITAATGLQPAPAKEAGCTEFKGDGLPMGDVMKACVSKNDNVGILYTTVGRMLIESGIQER